MVVDVTSWYAAWSSRAPEPVSTASAGSGDEDLGRLRLGKDMGVSKHALDQTATVSSGLRLQAVHATAQAGRL